MFKPFKKEAGRSSHLEQSFITQRLGMGLLAFSFPVLFLVSSFVLQRTDFQTSISAYYWTEPFERNFFVGVLCAMAVFLVLYKGYNWIEDWVLNVAGISAAGVAFIPMVKDSDFIYSGFSLHGTCAVLFFACIAYICIFMSEHSLKEMNDPDRERKFRNIYRWTAFFMFVSVATAVLLNFLPDDIYKKLCENNIIFWIEAVGVWSFSVFWYVKTRELDPGRSWIPFRMK